MSLKAFASDLWQQNTLVILWKQYILKIMLIPDKYHLHDREKNAKQTLNGAH